MEDTTASDQSLSQAFYSAFNTSYAEIVLHIESNVPHTTLSNEVGTLRKMLVDAKTDGYLPAYDQRQSELKLKELEERVERLRASTAPKSRFAFKRSPATAVSSSPLVPAPANVQASSTAATEPSRSPAHSKVSNPIRTIVIGEHENARLSLPAPVATDGGSEAAHVALEIRDLKRCVVDLRFSDDGTTREKLEVSGAQMSAVQDCVVVLPPVQGSLLARGLERCALVVSCHQLRMHDSTDVDVYLHCTSAPAIEACTGIRFTRYPKTMVIPAGGIDNATVSNSTNAPLNVQDFSHIRTDTPSPNYSVVSVDDMVQSEEWPTLLEEKDMAKIFHRCLSRES